ncbi:hypothetical protein GJV07_00665 [Enterobacteriaceae bacterium RIT711]|nr:hypothetical protein [Enterobacteriaceae bacterium RIT711]
MITLENMQAAYYEALERKNEIKARLRLAATELIGSYRKSLGLNKEHLAAFVTTGYSDTQGYTQAPVTTIELDNSKALNFILTTTIDSNPLRKFIVSVSLAMREQDGFVSVGIEGDPVPVLLLHEGTDDRYAEAVEAIKIAAMKKIDQLV